MSYTQGARPLEYTVVGKMGVVGLIFTAFLAVLPSGYAAKWDYRDIFLVDHIIFTQHIV